MTDRPRRTRLGHAEPVTVVNWGDSPAGGLAPLDNDFIDTPAADTAAVIIVDPGPGRVGVISGVAWSYNDTPTGGRLSISAPPAADVFDIDITAAGAGFIPFNPPRTTGPSEVLIATLWEGGAGVVGKLNLLGYWVQTS